MSEVYRNQDDETDPLLPIQLLGIRTEQGNEENTQMLVVEDERPLPRDHSYLSGSSHPLLPSNGPLSIETTSKNFTDTRDKLEHSHCCRRRFSDLAILELTGVVLFPGSVIPVKLRDPTLIAYLGHQIELCRNQPHLQPQVRLGILTYERPKHRRRIQRTSRQQHQQSRSHLVRSRETSPWNPNQRSGRGISMSTQRRIADDEDDDDSDNLFPVERRSQSTPSTQREHPFVGRIGTIATIQCTQERSTVLGDRDRGSDEGTRSHGRIWSRYEDAPELVFTAIGTGRFQVVSPSHTNTNHHVFCVLELGDTPLEKPPLLANRRLFASRPGSLHRINDINNGKENVADTQIDSDVAIENESIIDSNSKSSRLQPHKAQYHDQFAWNLSLITPIPHFVYERQWPWRIVDELIALLQEESPIQQSNKNLPSLGNTSQDIQQSPTRFSFWMASNMPFTQEERLKLLRIHSTLQRLMLIREKVIDLMREKQVSYLACSRCDLLLSTVTNVFHFQGAEGTTSNYGTFVWHIQKQKNKTRITLTPRCVLALASL